MVPAISWPRIVPGLPHHGGDVDVAAADATAGDPHDHLAPRRDRVGPLDHLEVGRRGRRDRGTHPLLDHDDGRAVVA